MAGDHAVAGDLLLLHPEVGAAVHDEAVHLHEGARVEEQLDPLAGGELARLVLLLDALGAAAGERAAVELVEGGLGIEGGGAGAGGDRVAHRAGVIARGGPRTEPKPGKARGPGNVVHNFLRPA